MKVLAHQNIIDISIQESGSVEALFDLLLLNSKSLTDDLEVGEDLLLPKEALNKRVANYFENRDVATGQHISKSHTELEGISYWAVNNNFKVS